MRTLHLAMLLGLAAPAAIAQNAVDVKPSPQQVAWQDMEMGAIIHFGTNTFLNREWGDGTAPPSVFNPQHVDTDQWIGAAKSAGIRYVVLVAKHHDGFALYPTEQTEYSVKSSPWLGGKGDLVRMVSDSARAQGLRFGVYLSPWDRHDPRYKDPAAYDKYYLAMLEELASHYGELTEFGLMALGVPAAPTTLTRSSIISAHISPMRSSLPMLASSNTQTFAGSARIAARSTWRTGMSAIEPVTCAGGR